MLRINCLSTEFSGQKGVKGLPLHVVVDTYEFQDNDRITEHDEPSHRAYCRVKIFRDKVGTGIIIIINIIYFIYYYFRALSVRIKMKLKVLRDVSRSSSGLIILLIWTLR